MSPFLYKIVVFSFCLPNCHTSAHGVHSVQRDAPIV